MLQLTRVLSLVSSSKALPTRRHWAWHVITSGSRPPTAVAAAAGSSSQPASTGPSTPISTATSSKRPRRMPGRYTCPACGNTSHQVDNLLHHMRKCCSDLLPPARQLPPTHPAAQPPAIGPLLEGAEVEQMLAAAQQAEAQLRSKVLKAARQLVGAAAAAADAASGATNNADGAAAGSSSSQGTAGHASQRSTRHRAPALVDLLSLQQCQQLAADMQLPVSRCVAVPEAYFVLRMFSCFFAN